MSDDEVLPTMPLVHEWLDAIGYNYGRVQGNDGMKVGQSWVWCKVYMDFDHIQAFLLEVDEPGPEIELYGQPTESRVADMMAVISYPWNDGKGHHDRRLDVTWRNVPYQRFPGDKESRATAAEGWVWFANHVEGWFDELWAEDERRHQSNIGSKPPTPPPTG